MAVVKISGFKLIIYNPNLGLAIATVDRESRVEHKGSSGSILA